MQRLLIVTLYNQDQIKICCSTDYCKEKKNVMKLLKALGKIILLLIWQWRIVLQILRWSVLNVIQFVGSYLDLSKRFFCSARKWKKRSYLALWGQLKLPWLQSLKTIASNVYSASRLSASLKVPRLTILRSILCPARSMFANTVTKLSKLNVA